MRASISKFSIWSMVFAMIFLASCKKESKPEQNTTQTESTTHYPVWTSAEMARVRAAGSSGDLIFSEYGVSMGMPNQSAVGSFLNFVIPDQKIEISSCPSDANLFINDANGDLLVEIYLYLMPPCHHVTIVENGKIMAAADLTSQGLSFYQGVIDNYRKQMGE